MNIYTLCLCLLDQLCNNPSTFNITTFWVEITVHILAQFPGGIAPGDFISTKADQLMSTLEQCFITLVLKSTGSQRRAFENQQTGFVKERLGPGQIPLSPTFKRGINKCNVILICA